MTDILERLRDRIHDAPMPSEWMMDEAADEIERIRQQRDALLEALEDLVSSMHAINRPDVVLYLAPEIRFARSAISKAKGMPLPPPPSSKEGE